MVDELKIYTVERFAKIWGLLAKISETVQGTYCIDNDRSGFFYLFHQ